MATAIDNDQPSILVIRRDNIGDLLCTTPLISRLRSAFPGARIDALVNSYNAPVLAGNPDLDHVYFYIKAKHRVRGQTVLDVHLARLKLMWTLRQAHYNRIYLAGDGNVGRQLKLARWLGAGEVIGFAPEKGNPLRALNCPVPRRENGHEVERCWSLLGSEFELERPGPMTLRALPSELDRVRERLVGASGYEPKQPLVAIHISARKPLQRWPAECFVALMRVLHVRWQAQFMLFWSPGDESNPLHPGDDSKAAAILDSLGDLPVIPYPTLHLEELTAGLSVCQFMVCSDGGAMHMGAALGLPVVSFFGNSDSARWYPWAVPHEVLQKPSRSVADVTVEEAQAACERLWARLLPAS